MSKQTCPIGSEAVVCYPPTDDRVTSLYGMAVIFVVAFVVFSPLMFRATNAVFGGALATNTGTFSASPNWKGWMLHVLVGAGVGYFLTLLFMKMFKTPRRARCEKTQ